MVVCGVRVVLLEMSSGQSVQQKYDVKSEKGQEHDVHFQAMIVSLT
jgi:hypothetical protein